MLKLQITATTLTDVLEHKASPVRPDVRKSRFSGEFSFEAKVEPKHVRIDANLRKQAIELCVAMATGRYGEFFGGCCEERDIDIHAVDGAAELARQALWQRGGNSADKNLNWTRAAEALRAWFTPADDPRRGVRWT